MDKADRKPHDPILQLFMRTLRLSFRSTGAVLNWLLVLLVFAVLDTSFASDTGDVGCPVSRDHHPKFTWDRIPLVHACP